MSLTSVIHEALAPTSLVRPVRLRAFPREPLQTGLNTPQRYVPLAVFAAVPMFTQEFYVVDAETLLMGCFFMFLGCVVDVSHETVSKALSEKVSA